MEISFTVYGQPKGKGRPRFSKFGHVYTPQKTADYENNVQLSAGIAMRGISLFADPIEVEINAYFDIPQSYSKKKKQMALSGELLPAKKPDIDNIQKAILDGCNKIVWSDDAIICKIIMTKEYSEKPRIEVKVRSMK